MKTPGTQRSARQLALPIPAGADEAPERRSGGGAPRARTRGLAREQGVLPLHAGHEAPPATPPGPAEVRERAQALADALRALLQADVRLTVTDNRCSLVTVKWRKRVWHYRVHHMFLDADAEVRDALACFGSGRRKKTAGAVLDAFIERHRSRIKEDPAAGPRAPAPPRGRHHDLQALFDRINREYFDGRVVARIGWGESRRARRNRKRRRSIKMGSYVHDARLIRIHPALDRPDVPDHYVGWVVYHEMLHQVVPPVRKNGRTYYHPPEFRRLEKAYREVERAQAWENAHFELLLEA